MTRDTGEEFQETVVDWDGLIIDPFDEFVNRVFRTCQFLQTRCRYVAPKLCKRVTLSKSDTAATESSAAATESRSVTPSDTRPSTPTGNLTTKGGASKPPTGESAGESARTATPNLGEKPTKKLSAYEIERNKNIARNKKLLARLVLPRS
jgi:hypothetical protein